MAGATCTLNNLRFGIQGQYHFRPDRGLDPWLGLSFGYELMWGSAERTGDGSFVAEYGGWEYANLHAGAAMPLASGFRAGPFGSVSVAEYSTRTQDGATVEIDSTALHHWLLVGLEGAFAF